ncbi:MAG: GntR family transcriptional regulator [Anaerolineales bacterium]|nr:MAG: GntR family transcriptional regulator [Anaerolineales bacterium]
MAEQGRLSVDKTCPVQLWYQLRTAMVSQIVSGAWQAGDQIPTEKQLCQALDVSRSTVRKAFESLVRDGFVLRTPGKGTFVAARPMTHIRVPPLGFHRTMTGRGYAVRSRVLQMQVISAPRDLIENLNLHQGAEILYIHRLRYLNDRPMVLSKNYLVHELCRGIENEDLRAGSLWAKLEAMLGRQVVGGIHTFYAVPATDDERELLQLPENVPMLMSVGINYLDDGTPFERAEVKITGDSGFLVARHVAQSASLPVDIGAATESYAR